MKTRLDWHQRRQHEELSCRTVVRRVSALKQHLEFGCARFGECVGEYSFEDARQLRGVGAHVSVSDGQHASEG